MTNMSFLVAVEPVQPAHLPKLIAALNYLARIDAAVRVSTASTGEHIVAASSPEFLSVCERA